MAEHFAAGTLEWKGAGDEQRVRYRPILGGEYNKKLPAAGAEKDFFQCLAELRGEAVRLTLSGYWPRQGTGDRG